MSRGGETALSTPLSPVTARNSSVHTCHVGYAPSMYAPSMYAPQQYMPPQYAPPQVQSQHAQQPGTPDGAEPQQPLPLQAHIQHVRTHPIRSYESIRAEVQTVTDS